MEDSSFYKGLTEKLSFLFQMLPGIIGLAYVLGFVIVNSYISSYDFFDRNIVSFDYLVSGVMLLVFLVPIIIIVYVNYPNPTDNLSENWIEALNSIHFILAYALLVDVILQIGGSEKLTKYISSMSLLLFVIIKFALTSFGTGKIKYLCKLLWLIGVLVVYHIVSLFFLPVNIVLKGVIIAVGIGTFAILGQVGDKNYDFGRLVVLIIQAILVAALVGRYGYDSVPSYFGGGMVKEVKCLVSETNIGSLRDMGIKVDDKGILIGKVIFSSDDYYLIESNNKHVSIRKDWIDIVQSHK
ncbi:hypothetical protein [Owenweeksia hongkongensis]|uniref:hypothetical protein n=1 Tax=Owenweeksia hongkongensis TaxID=253245 RepID=UPI003A934449